MNQSVQNRISTCPPPLQQEVTSSCTSLWRRLAPFPPASSQATLLEHSLTQGSAAANHHYDVPPKHLSHGLLNAGSRSCVVCLA